MAVGRVDLKTSWAVLSSLISSSGIFELLWIAASASPKAAVTPIAGAPLTIIFLMALATWL